MSVSIHVSHPAYIEKIFFYWFLSSRSVASLNSGISDCCSAAERVQNPVGRIIQCTCVRVMCYDVKIETVFHTTVASLLLSCNNSNAVFIKQIVNVTAMLGVAWCMSRPLQYFNHGMTAWVIHSILHVIYVLLYYFLL